MKKISLLLSFMLTISSLQLVAATEITEETTTTTTITETYESPETLCFTPPHNTTILYSETAACPNRHNTNTRIMQIGCVLTGFVATFYLIHNSPISANMKHFFNDLLAHSGGNVLGNLITELIIRPQKDKNNTTIILTHTPSPRVTPRTHSVTTHTATTKMKKTTTK